MSFVEFIDDMGLDALSEKLKVNPVTIRYWKVGHTWPRVPLMMKIKKMTQGGITYAKMIDGIPRQTAR